MIQDQLWQTNTQVKNNSLHYKITTTYCYDS